MAMFNHQHSKLLDLTAGSHKPAKGVPVHWLSSPCSFFFLFPLCSNNSPLSLSPHMTRRKMTSVLGGSLLLVMVIPVPWHRSRKVM